ncbi:helix-turn-helix domain-containing protein [Metallosphaera sp.]|uniref:helix-turn-helix domain-containing protein n=1 Tax=Metallosphaera sp. TaxID=2020860 RepID=UPI003165DAA6
MTLKKVTMTVKHEGCWTEDVNAHTVTLNLEVYPEKGYLRSWLISDSRELKDRMRREPSVKKITRVYGGKDSTLIDFLNVYEGSIAGALYALEVLIIGNHNKGGLEHWSFVTGQNSLSEIRSRISSLAKITDFRAEDYVLSYPSLTEMERRVLHLALDNGYLEYPREVDSERLAKVLGVSKVTFLYHWRNVQRKVMKYMATNMGID